MLLFITNPHVLLLWTHQVKYRWGLPGSPLSWCGVCWCFQPLLAELPRSDQQRWWCSAQVLPQTGCWFPPWLFCKTKQILPSRVTINIKQQMPVFWNLHMKSSQFKELYKPNRVVALAFKCLPRYLQVRRCSYTRALNVRWYVLWGENQQLKGALVTDAKHVWRCFCCC